MVNVAVMTVPYTHMNGKCRNLDVHTRKTHVGV